MDCIKGMRKLDDGCVDVIVTSPPYNIGMPYNGYEDKMDREAYLDWLEKVGIECRRILADDGSFFLNMGGKPSDQMLPFEAVLRMREIFNLQNNITWVKSIAIPNGDIGKSNGIKEDISVGHYKPVNSARYLSGCAEFIFHLTKNGDVKSDKMALGVPYTDKTNMKRWKNGSKGLRDRGNTWFIPYDTIQESRPHPAVFPTGLPKMCIEFHGISEGMLVMDPFMGIGTTAIACRCLGVDYLGFEIDPSYIEIAMDRFDAIKT